MAMKSSSVCALEPEKITKTKWSQYYGTPSSYAFDIEKSVAFFHRKFFFSDYLCSVGEVNAVCGESDTGGPLTLWEEDNR